MNCPNCGAPVGQNDKFCLSCGSTLPVGSSYLPTQPGYQQPNISAPQPPPVYTPVVPPEAQIPYRYRPLGAWAYCGYSILFSIPIVGFILLIVFACSDDNINRRNYARSYFCWLLIAAIIFVVLLLLGVNLAFLLSNAVNL